MSKKQPNFLVIVADDLGYSDIGCFGGEISTPNIDSLAAHGSRFTDFHTAAACSPTRAMLLSGTDHHLTGLGQLNEFVRYSPAHQGKPGHEGYLTEKVAPLPEVLRDSGYHTVMAGKWHLGLRPEFAPIERGFTRSFSLLPGCANHYGYEPQLEDQKDLPGFFETAMAALHIEDDKYVDNKTLPEDFYSSDYYGDKLVGYLKERPKDQPFFAYLPFSAPHWPLQAPKETTDKYRGVYDEGPSALKSRRLDAMIEKGLVDASVKDKAHPFVNTGTKEWDDMTDEQRAKSAKSMETYAGMVDRLDYNIGKVLDEIKVQGEYENTVVVFMSDNGAEGASYEALPVNGDRIMEHIDQYYDNSLENIGRKDSFVWYGCMWAQAATAPSRLYKMFCTEGGCRVPFVYKGANGVNPENICFQFSTVMDIMPTFLELAGVPKPGKVFKGREVVSMRGASWAPYFKKERERIHPEDHITGWELVGQASLRQGDWKIDFVAKPYGPEQWQLYNLKEDPGETTDLAEQYPDKLKKLVEHWEDYANETGVVGLKPEFGTVVLEDEMDDPVKWMNDTSYGIMNKIKAGEAVEA